MGAVSGDLEQLVDLVGVAQNVVVLTGAGISTDSAIPDFRGPNGVWTKNPSAEKSATLQHYLADPEVRRSAWRNRLDAPLWDAEPNAGHRALVALERLGKLDTLITQNVDGLHQAAGTDPAKVVEIHGTAREVVCMSCDYRAPMADALQRVRAGEADPECPRCGGILKSATISFGQGLVASDLRRSEDAASRADLLIAIGSTLSVFPVAGVVPLARSNGADVAIINGEPTGMDHLGTVVIRGSISDVLVDLVDALSRDALSPDALSSDALSPDALPPDA